jgi:hypothetical protein
MPIENQRPPRQNPFGLSALIAAVAAGFGLGLVRRPYAPRGTPAPAVPQPTDAALAPAVPQVIVSEVHAEPAALHPAAFPVTEAHPVTPVEPVARADAPEEPARPSPTPLGLRVVEILRGSGPLRKHQIAEMAGIGRGSAVRIVDRLVDERWVRFEGEGLYGVA